MSSPARRIADLEALIGNREPDGPPTWTFFAQDRFMAQANYGGSAPDVVLQDIEDVERTIRAYDEYRVDHRLDLIDTAILISCNAFPSDNPSPSGIAGMIVEAYWHWDRQRFGEDRAWRRQRSRSEFEGIIPDRIARLQQTAAALE